MTDYLSDEIVKLMEEYKPVVEQPGDWTTAKAMKFWDCSKDIATKTLNKMVKEGHFEKMEDVILESGSTGFVWRPIVASPEKEKTAVETAK